MQQQQLQMQQQMYEHQMERQREMLDQQRKHEKQRKAQKKLDIYDRYTGVESTSGYSMYSDKYRIVGAAKAKKQAQSEPRAKIEDEQRMGAQLDKGQFARPVGVVAAGAAATSLLDREEVDINVSESCGEDFLETMFTPPMPPTTDQQRKISQGVYAMATASNNAIAEDDCGILMPMDEGRQPTNTVKSKHDWYGEEEHMTRDSCVGDFFHSLWTCR